MVKIVHSRTFNSGNSVALRLPKDFGIAAGTDVEMIDDGQSVTIRRKRKLTTGQLVELLRKMGPPADGVQKRESFEYPDRPGL